MDWKNIGINLACSFILFFLNGWFGNIQLNLKDLFKYGKFTFESNTETNFSGNFFQKIVNPTVYLAGVCAVLQNFPSIELLPSTWLIVPLYWVLRLLHIFVKNLISFINWKYELFSLFVSLALSGCTFHFLIAPLSASDKSIFIDIEAFRDAFWFAAIAYLAKMIWEISKKQFESESVFPDQKRRDILSRRFYKFNNRYGYHIDNCISKNCISLSPEHIELFKCLIFAVMIYEDYCRPPIVRGIEYLWKFLNPKKAMSLGIMQVQSPKMINNLQSISSAIEKLYDAFQASDDLDEQVNAAIRDYNNGDEYLTEVTAIYTYLVDLNGLSEDIDIEEETCDEDSEEYPENHCE